MQPISFPIENLTVVSTLCTMLMSGSSQKNSLLQFICLICYFFNTLKFCKERSSLVCCCTFSAWHSTDRAENHNRCVRSNKCNCSLEVSKFSTWRYWQAVFNMMIHLQTERHLNYFRKTFQVFKEPQLFHQNLKWQ